MIYQILYDFCKLTIIIVKTRYKNIRLLEIIDKKVISRLGSKSDWIEGVVGVVLFFNIGISQILY